MKWMIGPVLILSMLVSGCGQTGLSGTWGGPSCPYEGLRFHSGGKAEMVFLGIYMQIDYVVDGETIFLNMGGDRRAQLVKRGDRLFLDGSPIAFCERR